MPGRKSRTAATRQAQALARPWENPVFPARRTDPRPAHWPNPARLWRWCRRKHQLAGELHPRNDLFCCSPFRGSGRPLPRWRIDRGARELAEVRLLRRMTCLRRQQAFENGNLGPRSGFFGKRTGPSAASRICAGFEWRYCGISVRSEQLSTLFSGHSNVVAMCGLLPGRQDAGLRSWECVGEIVGCRKPTTRGHALRPIRSVSALAWPFSNDGETLATADDDGLKLLER